MVHQDYMKASIMCKKKGENMGSKWILSLNIMYVNIYNNVYIDNINKLYRRNYFSNIWSSSIEFSGGIMADVKDFLNQKEKISWSRFGFIDHHSNWCFLVEVLLCVCRRSKSRQPKLF